MGFVFQIRKIIEILNMSLTTQLEQYCEFCDGVDQCSDDCMQFQKVWLSQKGQDDWPKEEFLARFEEDVKECSKWLENSFVRVSLKQKRENIQKLPLFESFAENFKPVGETERSSVPTLIFIGDFAVGKSTFINSVVLGEDVLPFSSCGGTTHTWEIIYGDVPQLQIVHANGGAEDVFVPEFTSSCIGKLTKKLIKKFGNITFRLYWSCKLLLFMNLIDTPGLNSRSYNIERDEILTCARRCVGVVVMVCATGMTKSTCDIVSSLPPNKKTLGILTHTDRVYQEIANRNYAQRVIQNTISQLREVNPQAKTADFNAEQERRLRCGYKRCSPKLEEVQKSILELIA